MATSHSVALQAVGASRGGKDETVIERTDKDQDGNDEWDLEGAEKRPAVKHPRAVVSVAFRRNDFETVAAAADRFGERLSEFIREAALARARPQKQENVSVSLSGLPTGYFATPYLSGAITGLLPHQLARPEPEFVTR